MRIPVRPWSHAQGSTWLSAGKPVMWCTLHILQRDKQSDSELYFSHKWSTIWRHPAAARNSSNWRRDLPLQHCTHQSTAKSHRVFQHRATTGTKLQSHQHKEYQRMQFSTKKRCESLDSWDAWDPQGCSNSWPSILSWSSLPCKKQNSSNPMVSRLELLVAKS